MHLETQILLLKVFKTYDTGKTNYLLYIFGKTLLFCAWSDFRLRIESQVSTYDVQKAVFKSYMAL